MACCRGARLGDSSVPSPRIFAAKAAAGFGKEVKRALFSKIQTLSFGSGHDRLSTLDERLTSDSNQAQTGVNLALRLFAFAVNRVTARRYWRLRWKRSPGCVRGCDSAARSGDLRGDARMHSALSRGADALDRIVESNAAKSLGARVCAR
jgi:hypothetical protein